jgi:subtilase family serine protease
VGVSDLGEADGTRALNNITLRFTMTAAQKAALIQLLEDQQNPASPKYHQWLTPEQFAAQFGMSSSDLATVSQWLSGQGFKVTTVARSGTFIQASGSVAQAEVAFKTSIHKVSVNGEEHIANVTAVSLPSGIASVVASVSGLDDFKLKPRSRVHQVPASANPKFTSASSGNTYVAPGDFYTIYDVNPLLSSSINGTGVTIAVAGQTDISLSDVAAFRSAAGLTANVPTVKLYGTDPGTSSNDIDEAQLDVEWSGAVAPSASILYVNSTDVINSLTQIIDNKLAPIASISYGDCEPSEGAAALNSLNTLFMQANAQGMTVVGPGGDSGATDCDYQATSATLGLAVDFPASSPYVTGLGGTMFNEGTGTYWKAASGSDVINSAISYIPEDVWNETSEAGELAAGGGGLSAYFTKPYWQTGTGVPNDFARDVPDVSLNAAADHDGYLFCSQGSCVDGFRTAAGYLDVVGGTSVAAPAFAGILALVEQKIGSSIGNANPVIYALANSTYYNNVFHDVTVGNNASPCTTGSADCPSGGSIGYNANVGYDLATGWGSVDAYNLANDWNLVTPVVGGTTGTAVSTTAVTASAASVAAGTTVTITATVANGTSTSLAAPTGTVQFLVDNVVSGGAVTLTGGVATFSLATSALSSGAHVVSAAYSGDAVYLGSKGSVSVDVTSATSADFTLTPATATVTVKSGADATGLVYTVTPVNGFTGSVAFTANTTSSTLNATYSFSVTPVTITSTAAGTTTLTLSAYVANAKSGSGRLRLTPVKSAAIAPSSSAGYRGWYAGSGAALACVFLLVVPKRRRWSGLLAVVMALGVVSMMTGCGDSSSTVQGTTNAAPGTYTIFVTATGTSSGGATLTHTSTVTFVVQ